MNLLRCFAVIILAIVEVIIILLLIFLRKRLMIAIALIKEASKSVFTLLHDCLRKVVPLHIFRTIVSATVPFRAVGHVMSSLFYPLLTFALLAVVIAYWAITAVYPSLLCVAYV